MNVAANKRLWFFDFDGTLSLIVPDRSEASIHPACKKLLEEIVVRDHNHVAVLSSRLLDDLIPRVGVPGVFLGGGSGVEWFVEGKTKWIADEKLEHRLKTARRELLPQIMKVAVIPGVEVEDKKWSVAIHSRKSNAASKSHIASVVENLSVSLHMRVFKGPEVFEMQFLPEINKAYGVQALCKYLGLEPGSGEIVYAGDDENDAAAMEWVLRHGGIAITVNQVPLASGASVVEGPEALAKEIHRLFRRKGEKSMEVTSCTFSR